MTNYCRNWHPGGSFFCEPRRSLGEPALPTISISCARHSRVPGRAILSASTPLLYCPITCTRSGSCRRMILITRRAGGSSRRSFRVASPVGSGGRKAAGRAASVAYGSGAIGSIRCATRAISSDTPITSISTRSSMVGQAESPIGRIPRFIARFERGAIPWIGRATRMGLRASWTSARMRDRGVSPAFAGVNPSYDCFANRESPIGQTLSRA